MAEYVDIDYPFTAFTDRGQTIETSIRKIMQTNPFLDIPTMTDEELKAEASRRGYTLVPKPPKQIKLIPCKCGRKTRFEKWYDGAFGGNKVVFRCPDCGAESEPARSERTARQNWNRMQGG